MQSNQIGPWVFIAVVFGYIGISVVSAHRVAKRPHAIPELQRDNRKAVLALYRDGVSMSRGGRMLEAALAGITVAPDEHAFLLWASRADGALLDPFVRVLIKARDNGPATTAQPVSLEHSVANVALSAGEHRAIARIADHGAALSTAAAQLVIKAQAIGPEGFWSPYLDKSDRLSASPAYKLFRVGSWLAPITAVILVMSAPLAIAAIARPGNASLMITWLGITGILAIVWGVLSWIALRRDPQLLMRWRAVRMLNIHDVRDMPPMFSGHYWATRQRNRAKFYADDNVDTSRYDDRKPLDIR